MLGTNHFNMILVSDLVALVVSRLTEFNPHFLIVEKFNDSLRLLEILQSLTIGTLEDRVSCISDGGECC